jgi:serine/threonine protein phosphatase PrpC
VRQDNEDGWLADAEAGIWVVVDGMGANGTCMELVHRVLSAMGEGDLENRLRAASELVEGLDPTFGGACLSAIDLRPESMRFATVGDCRVYLWRRGAFSQLSEDDTLLRLRVERGEAQPHQVYLDPYGNIVTASLVGGSGHVFSVQECPLEPGDRVLLCTDGVWRSLEPALLAALLEGDPRDVARTVVDRAFIDGSDNATAVLVIPGEVRPAG